MEQAAGDSTLFGVGEVGFDVFSGEQGKRPDTHGQADDVTGGNDHGQNRAGHGQPPRFHLAYLGRAEHHQSRQGQGSYRYDGKLSTADGGGLRGIHRYDEDGNEKSDPVDNPDHENGDSGSL